jgi:transposase InsO family protein
LAGVSREGFYRHLRVDTPTEEEILVRERLQQLALAEKRRMGYRPLTHMLRKEGFVVNHKRVLRLMREDNLLSLQMRKYVFTTDSRHPWPVYPNLVPGVRVCGINQLWIADITFVRLRWNYIYLAVVLDAYSRRVVGWELSESLDAELAVQALKMALRERQWLPGQLVHHSDRGIQYAAGNYVALLQEREILISMSRKGNPYDNAKAERFMRTLKQEEVQGRAYGNMKEARSRIGMFLEETYNKQRLHSALKYLTPAEFEQQERKAVEVDGSVEGVENEKAVSHALPLPLEIPLGFPQLPQPESGI